MVVGAGCEQWMGGVGEAVVFPLKNLIVDLYFLPLSAYKLHTCAAQGRCLAAVAETAAGGGHHVGWRAPYDR